MPVTFELLQGANTIDFAWRESEARLDKIFVTNEDLSVRNVVRNNSIDDPYSLRYALDNACPSDTITFADSTNTLIFPVDENTLEINFPLTIMGNGIEQTTIDGLNLHPLFINHSYQFTLKDLKLSNGFSISNGGAILNNGTLHLSGVTFENNYEGTIPKAFTNNGIIYIDEYGEVYIIE